MAISKQGLPKRKSSVDILREMGTARKGMPKRKSSVDILMERVYE